MEQKKKHIYILRLLWALAVPFLIITGLFFYMRWEYDNIKVRELPLEMQGKSKDAESWKKLKIVFATDFQYDMRPNSPKSVRTKILEKAIETINSQHGDIILLGGDFQTFASNCEVMLPYFEKLDAPMGVYAVCGNHDADAAQMMKEKLTNINFIDNQTVVIEIDEERLEIVGAADLWTAEPKIDNVQGEAHRILLTHNPDFFEQLPDSQANGFDLMLAGHLHAGQATLFGKRGIGPVINTVTAYGEKYRYGEKYYGGNRYYISSGLGGAVFGMPLRFFAQPEIVVFDNSI